MGACLLALAAAYIGWVDRTVGRFEVSTGTLNVHADSRPVDSIPDGMLLEPPQSVTEAGRTTIALSFRPSMIPF